MCTTTSATSPRCARFAERAACADPASGFSVRRRERDQRGRDARTRAAVARLYRRGRGRRCAASAGGRADADERAVEAYLHGGIRAAGTRQRLLRTQPGAVGAMGGLPVRRLSRRHARRGDEGAADHDRRNGCEVVAAGAGDARRIGRVCGCALADGRDGGDRGDGRAAVVLVAEASAGPAGLSSFRWLCRRNSGSVRRMKFGIDRMIYDPALREPLRGKRVALVAHPASVTEDLPHSMDAIATNNNNKQTAAFGPQHGLRGDKQDNMVESPDFTDPRLKIPVFSLYGEVRRPSGQMMSTFDVVLFDLQDLGCRIYTFVTTLLYMLEAAAKSGKEVWVLDRPNPAGRPIEGLTLREGWESFVGAGPMPMRHGLTLGEMGRWFIDHFRLDVDYRVIAMEGWRPDEAPGFGWPPERVWINPSPNAANLNMARAKAGTVMREGTPLSEGRGTTRALELFGASDIEPARVLAEMHSFSPQWLAGCKLRDVTFQPTNQKHAGQL